MGARFAQKLLLSLLGAWGGRGGRWYVDCVYIAVTIFGCTLKDGVVVVCVGEEMLIVWSRGRRFRALKRDPSAEGKHLLPKYLRLAMISDSHITPRYSLNPTAYQTAAASRHARALGT